MKRYPIQSLFAAMRADSLADTLAFLKLSGSTWTEYRDQGISAHVAHRLADKVGLVATAVWPELIDAELEGMEVECAASDCDVVFVRDPAQRGKPRRYCSSRCASRVSRRRRYHEDPVLREAQKARRRAYYEACGEYERAREKRRYDARRSAA